VPVLYTSRCGLCNVSGVPIRIHCENRSHLRPRRKQVHTCKALIALHSVVSSEARSCGDGRHAVGTRWAAGMEGAMGCRCRVVVEQLAAG
jgi:hypothetical protein